VCEGQVCSKAIYDTEVAYHDSTEVRTDMAFHQQVRLPLLEKWMLIARDPLFWYIAVLHHVTVSNLIVCTSVLRMTKTSCHKFILCLVHETADGRNLPSG